MSIRDLWRPRVMPHPGTHQDTPLLQPRLALPPAPERPTAPLPAPVQPAPVPPAPEPRWHWPCPAIDRLQYHIGVMREITDEKVRAAYFQHHYGYAFREKAQAEAGAELAKVMTP